MCFSFYSNLLEKNGNHFKDVKSLENVITESTPIPTYHSVIRIRLKGTNLDELT